MNEQVHCIFPTVVFEDFYDDYDKFLNILSNTWKSHFYNGYSNESTNNLDLQTDIRYKDLYRQLTQSVKKYLHQCGVVYDNFDINFVKSWFNILEKSTTPLHSHGDAHISVVYYANVPSGMEQYLRFHYFDKDRQPFPGLFDFNSFENNEFNSRTYSLLSQKGQIFVFSSKIPHDTFGDGKVPHMPEEPNTTFKELKSKRICIASDVVLTYKEKQNKPLGLQPVKNWRTFDE